jgi:hypothetical protein
MIGRRVGYVRVSSFDQNPERQLEDVDLDRTFSDKASGKDAKRPQLEALMTFVRAGETVVVHSMDRLARNLDDLRQEAPHVHWRGFPDGQSDAFGDGGVRGVGYFCPSPRKVPERADQLFDYHGDIRRVNAWGTNPRAHRAE